MRHRIISSSILASLIGLAIVIFNTGAKSGAEEKLPANANLVSLEVKPDNINLKNRFEYSQLLITGLMDNGDKVDLTRQAKIEAPEILVKVTPAGVVRPIADGTGEIKFSLA